MTATEHLLGVIVSEASSLLAVINSMHSGPVPLLLPQRQSATQFLDASAGSSPSMVIGQLAGGSQSPLAGGEGSWPPLALDLLNAAHGPALLSVEEATQRLDALAHGCGDISECIC